MRATCASVVWRDACQVVRIPNQWVAALNFLWNSGSLSIACAENARMQVSIISGQLHCVQQQYLPPPMCYRPPCSAIVRDSDLLGLMCMCSARVWRDHFHFGRTWPKDPESVHNDPGESFAQLLLLGPRPCRHIRTAEPEPGKSWVQRGMWFSISIIAVHLAIGAIWVYASVF